MGFVQEEKSRNDEKWKPLITEKSLEVMPSSAHVYPKQKIIIFEHYKASFPSDYRISGETATLKLLSFDVRNYKTCCLYSCELIIKREATTDKQTNKQAITKVSNNNKEIITLIFKWFISLVNSVTNRFRRR